MSVTVGTDPGIFESLWFYKNTIELRYNDVEHIYYLVDSGRLDPQDGCTTVVKIVDKSEMLVPWGCKMMAEKLLLNVPMYVTKNGRKMVSAMPYEVFLTLVMDAKTAHKDKLIEAADIGKEAHSWLEAYIKKQLGRIDVLPPMPTEECALSCCHSALGWMKAHNVRWLHTERKVYSRRYAYAGTMDGLCYCDSCTDPLCCPTPFTDRLSLADWKSSNYLYLVYLLQTASYEQAFEEEFLVDIKDRWLIQMAKDKDAPKLFNAWHLEEEDFDRDFQAFLTCLELTRSMRDLKARMGAVKDAIKAHEKALARAERQAALLKACTKSSKYQGIKGPPKCVDGEPCDACWAKYKARHPQAESEVMNGS